LMMVIRLIYTHRILGIFSLFVYFSIVFFHLSFSFFTFVFVFCNSFINCFCIY
jgi:hypothetical protein